MFKVPGLNRLENAGLYEANRACWDLSRGSKDTCEGTPEGTPEGTS